MISSNTSIGKQRNTSSFIRWRGNFFVVFCLICVLSISINRWRYSAYAGSNAASQKAFLRPGDTVSSLVVQDAAGRSRTLFPTKVNFILYFGKATAKSMQHATYAGFLAKHNNDAAVSFLVAASKSYPAYRDLYSTAPQNIFLVNDQRAEIADRLGIDPSETASVILDQDGKVLFGIPAFLDAEDLRQLYERYSRGKIDYSAAAQSSTALVGTTLPQFTVTEIHSNKTSKVSEIAGADSAEYWVFTANCPVCSLPSFLEALAHYYPQHHVTPIFSSRMPRPVLREVAAASAYAGPLYIADMEMTSFEDIYRNSAVSDFISIVKTDSHNRIISAIPASPFNIQEVLRSHEN